MTTASRPRVVKTPGVCGGDARIADTRIPVWLLVLIRKQGGTDADVLSDYPALSAADVDAGWDYYRAHPVEIEQAIWFNDTAADVPAGEPPPAWVLVAGRLLGLSEDEIREAFDPPLAADEVTAAWDRFRKDPVQVGRDIAHHRIAG